jgi:hypothetical protein
VCRRSSLQKAWPSINHSILSFVPSPHLHFFVKATSALCLNAQSKLVISMYIVLLYSGTPYLLFIFPLCDLSRYEYVTLFGSHFHRPDKAKVYSICMVSSSMYSHLILIYISPFRCQSTFLFRKLFPIIHCYHLVCTYCNKKRLSQSHHRLKRVGYIDWRVTFLRTLSRYFLLLRR